MKTTRIGLLALAAWLPGQEGGDGKAALSRAVVLEEQEHDLQAALAEYQRIAQDEGVPAEVRAEARLRLGMALLRAGKEAEGKATLEAVAALGGALGERARSALEARTVQDRELQARVQAAIDLLRTDPAKGRDEVRFLGAPAAAPLSRQLPLPPFDREFVAAGVALLLQLDDAVAAETLARLAKADVYERRAAASGLSLTGRPKVDGAVLAFLRDPDPEVRIAAIRQLLPAAPAADLVAAIADGTVAVREVLFARLADLVASGSIPNDRATALLPVCAAELAQAEPVAQLWPLVTRCLGGSADSMNLALRALRHPRCTSISHSQVGLTLQPNECLDEALATAEFLAEAPSDDGRRRRLSTYVQACETSWDRAALAKRLRLRALGYGNIEAWITQNAAAADLALILDHVPDLYVAGIAQWLQRQTIPAERWDRFAARAERMRSGGKEGHQDLRWATGFAVRTLHPDAMSWVVRFSPTHSVAMEAAIHALGEAGELPEHARAAVLALLDACLTDDVESGPLAAADGAPLLTLRGRLLRVACEAGIDAAASRFAPAYELGVGHGLAHLADSQREGMGLSPDAQARAFAECLATRKPQVYSDARTYLSALGHRRALPGDVYRELCRHALDAAVPKLRIDLVGELLQRHQVDPAAAESLFLASLAAGDSQLAERAAQAMARATLSADGTKALAERVRKEPSAVAIGVLSRQQRAEHADVLANLLAHPDQSIRSEAASGLARLRGADAIDALLPLADDPAMTVRYTLCTIAKTQLDRRYAPALLQLLRDQDERVRKVAQEALEAVEFYVTQTERWQRLLRGTGLEASSAAEALLGQAKAGNEKRVRLAAIRGLGSLGVKEALPFLIQMMQEQDAEIAAAASEAVDALNKR